MSTTANVVAHRTAATSVPAPMSEAPRIVYLVFDMERTPPLQLSLEPHAKLVRVQFNRWEAELPEELSRSPGRIKATWINPAERVVLREFRTAERGASLLASAKRYDIVQEYDDALQCTSSRDPHRDMKLFWLAVDLATSFESIEGSVHELEQRLKIDARMWKHIDVISAEGLRWLLDARWQARAVLSARGLAHEAFLPPVGGFRQVATRVSRLLRALFTVLFPDGVNTFDLQRVWRASLLFANGCLRRGGLDPKLNLEPNSAAIASLAELMDVTADRRFAQTEQEAVECANLRVVFASMLEPYFEVYRSGERRPCRAHLYSRTNLPNPIGRRDPRWDDERLTNLVEDYRRWTATDSKSAASRLPRLQERWGHTLAAALRDEPSVIAARRPHLTF